MLTRRLIVAGAEVVNVSNGVDGIKALENGTYDAILTDLMMPKMNGYEMIEEIKKNENTKHIPILVLTNHTSINEDTKRVMELGIDGFFIKSNTDLKDIVCEVARIIKRRNNTTAEQISEGVHGIVDTTNSPEDNTSQTTT